MGHNPTEYRRITVAGDGSDSDVWRVGGTAEGFPPSGWLVWIRTNSASGGIPEIRGNITLRAGWQTSEAEIELSDLEINHGGLMWVPWPRFELGPFLDNAASSVSSTIDLAACPLRPGIPIPPGASKVYSRTDAESIDAGASDAITPPEGATRYALGMDPAAGWTGPLQVAERSTGGGVNTVQRSYSLGNATSSIPTNTTGWQLVPGLPGDILLTNDDGSAACGVSVRWEIDFTGVR